MEHCIVKNSNFSFICTSSNICQFQVKLFVLKTIFFSRVNLLYSFMFCCISIAFCWLPFKCWWRCIVHPCPHRTPMPHVVQQLGVSLATPALPKCLHVVHKNSCTLHDSSLYIVKSLKNKIYLNMSHWNSLLVLYDM